MYLNLALLTKFARLQALNDAIGANASVVIYDGQYPASPDSATVANSLANFVCDSTGFGTVAVTPQLVGNAIINTVTLVSLPFAPVYSSANGSAGWARIRNAAGNAIVDLDIAANSSASISMNSTDLLTNVAVQIVSIILSEQ